MHRRLDDTMQLSKVGQCCRAHPNDKVLIGHFGNHMRTLIVVRERVHPIGEIGGLWWSELDRTITGPGDALLGAASLRHSVTNDNGIIVIVTTTTTTTSGTRVGRGQCERVVEHAPGNETTRVDDRSLGTIRHNGRATVGDGGLLRVGIARQLIVTATLGISSMILEKVLQLVIDVDGWFHRFQYGEGNGGLAVHGTTQRLIACHGTTVGIGHSVLNDAFGGKE